MWLRVNSLIDDNNLAMAKLKACPDDKSKFCSEHKVCPDTKAPPEWLSGECTGLVTWWL